MHTGLIAAKTPVRHLRDSMLQCWPEFEVVSSIEDLPDLNAMRAWMEAHEHPAVATDGSKPHIGSTMVAFWQDGPWAVLLDQTYVIPSDEQRLAALSRRVGTLLSLVVETAAGTLSFACFESGQLRRMIDGNDGVTTETGQPLPEESDIEISKFYMREAEALWKAFGLSPPYPDSCSSGFQAISVVGHTGYDDLNTLVDEHAPKEFTQRVRTRQWWKFW